MNNLKNKTKAELIKEIESLQKRIEKVDINGEQGINSAITRNVHFSKFFQSGPLLMTISNIDDGKYIEVNNNFNKITGYSRKDCIGKTSIEIGFISKVDREKLIQKLLSDGKIEGLELLLHKKSGEKMHCRYYGEIIEVDGEKKLLSIGLDITKAKIDQENLKESTQRFEAFMNNIPAGIFIKDESGKYLFSNRFNKDTHNVNDYVGKTAYDFFPKKIADKFANEDQRVVNGESLQTEGSVKDSKGKEFYYKNYQFGINQNDEKFLVAGISFDVTNEKLIEIELKESEEKFRALAQTAPIAILLYQDDKWVYANKRAEEICGYKISELKEFDFWKIVAPEFREIVKKRGAAREKGIQAENNYEFKIITKSGEEKWVLLNGNTINYGGKHAGLITVLDITNRKQQDEQLKRSNESFQEVVSNITTTVWKADVGNNNTFINTYISPVADELLELPKRTIKNSWDKYFSYVKNEYLEKINNAFNEAINSPGKVIDLEYEIIKENGKQAWFHSRGRCFKKGSKLYVFGTTEDISKRKKAEQNVKQSGEQLRNIFDNSTQIFYSHTADHIITYLSPQTEEILGYKPKEAMVRWTELASDDPINEIGFENTVRAIKTGKRQAPYELELVRKDGKKNLG